MKIKSNNLLFGNPIKWIVLVYANIKIIGVQL